MLSALQVKRGLQKGEPTFLVTLAAIESSLAESPIPKAIQEVLKEFEAVMSAELARTLPPHRPIDHKIELVAKAQPLAQSAYRMSPSKLTELRRQLDQLLGSSFMRRTNSPFGAPVFFQKK